MFFANLIYFYHFTQYLLNCKYIFGFLWLDRGKKGKIFEEKKYNFEFIHYFSKRDRFVLAIFEKSL
jgi:hypothetical protein